MVEKQEKGPVKRIVYVGDDNNYWDTIRGRIKHTYADKEFELLTIFDKNANKYQEVFVKVFDLKPSIIYIDLSKDFDTGIKIVRLIKIENSLKDIPLVGLVDKKELLNQCRAVGVDFVHVKCGEYNDVVYDPFCVAFPNEVQKPEFAEGKFQKEIRLVEDFRIGYITEKGIHVEGNIILEKGQLIEVETEIPKGLLPSNKFIVSAHYDNDFFYNYSHAYDLDFVFVDKPEFEEDADNPREAQRIHKEKMAEYANALKVSKKRLKDWVYERMDLSLPKKTKILIVDKDLGPLRNSTDKPLDSYPYSIRCQSEVTEELQEIHKNRPDLIVFQIFIDEEAEKKRERARVKKEVIQSMSNADGAEQAATPKPEATTTEEDDEEVDENYMTDEERSSVQQLTSLVGKAKELEGYNPFFLVFKSKKYSSKALQQSFKYPFILANTIPMALKQVLDLADMFQKKQQKKKEQAIDFKIKQLKSQDPVKYRKLTAADFEEKRYFIKKTNDMSHAAGHMLVELTTMTESELTFLSERELTLGVYRLDYPVDMGITLIKDGNSSFTVEGGLKKYRGLIHSIGEQDKKDLRITVNEVFFSGVNEKRAKEQQEFEEKKKAAMAEREKAVDQLAEKLQGKDDD